LAAFPALYAAAYALAGLHGVRLFPWYLAPLVPFYLLLTAVGLNRLRPWLVVAVLAWQAPAIDWSRPFVPVGLDTSRETLYLRVGESLRQTLPPGSLVAAPEIGALGYVSGLPILDTVGLVSPRALAYYPLPQDELVSDNAIPPGLIAERRPAAVVSLDEYVRRSLLLNPTFLHDYRLVASYPAPIWASQQLLVFRRVDA
jgi:hypothetical protein